MGVEINIYISGGIKHPTTVTAMTVGDRIIRKIVCP